MNYQKIYDSIIESAKTRKLVNCYKERHHIIPVCMNGEKKLKGDDVVGK